MWKDFPIILSGKANGKNYDSVFIFLEEKIYRKTLLKVSTYTKMLLGGGTGDEVYFAYGMF